jgi:hypothetical protein
MFLFSRSLLRISTLVVLFAIFNIGYLLSQIIQPPAFNPSQDTYVQVNGLIPYPPPGPNGNSTELIISRAGSHFLSNMVASLIQFDLSSIPTNAIITEAYLEFRLLQGASVEYTFNLIDESWDEAIVTPSNTPSDNAINQFNEAGSLVNINGISYHRFSHSNIRNMVQSWVSNPSTNYGFYMKSSVNTSVTHTNSYSSNNSSFFFIFPLGIPGPILQINPRPKLVLKYELPIEITLTSIEHATSTTATDGSITFSAIHGNQNYTYQWYNSSGNVIGTNSPTISGLGYGWYGVKVTDGANNQAYMSFIVGAECETVSISYNPGPNYVDDAYISNFRTMYQDLRNLNYGSSSSIYVRRVYSSNGYVGYFNYKGLLRFNLIIDHRLHLKKADLLVNVSSNSGTSNNPVLRLTNQNWKENTVTYMNQPTHNSFISQNTNITSTGVKQIDVKSFWTHWQSNSNHGFFIDLDNPSLNANRRTYLRSSDYSIISQRPRMEFEVSLKCAEPATLKERLEGGTYYLYRPFLKFHFDEQLDAETNENLKLEIYNSTNQVIASSEHTGTVTGIPLSPLHVTHGNFHMLNLSSLNLVTGASYTLVVETINGKKMYLNFTKVN